MRLLIVYRYFHPDTPPYAAMLKEMSSWFASAGHDVEVLTSQPTYKPDAGIEKQSSSEVMNGVRVKRLSLLPEKGMGVAKIINSGLFVLASFLKVLFGTKRDLIWTATQPPVLQAFVLSIAAKLRGSQFIYHLQDIHPEISFVNSNKPLGFVGKILQWLDTTTVKRASVCVVISPDMKEVLMERGGNPDRIVVLRNFALGTGADTTEVKNANPPTSLISNGPSSKTSFLFAGNIGRFQNLEALVEAFELVDAHQASLTLLGSGRLKQRLQAMVKDRNISNVHFIGHVSVEEAFKIMRTYDVGLISLTPQIYKYAFPSKLWTYIAADLRTLAFVENESNLASFLKLHEIGDSMPWESTKEAISAKVLEMCDPSKSNNSPAEKREIYHQSFAQQRWVKLLEQIHTQDQNTKLMEFDL